MTQSRTTRVERLAMPLARDVVKDVAIEHGACIRPIQLRRTDTTTGQAEPVLIPCGHTLAAICPACAERARTLRATECREGWHLDHEPVLDPDRPRTSSNGGSPNAPKPRPTATTPKCTVTTPPTTTHSSPNSTRKSARPGCAATSCPHGRTAATAPPAAARTPHHSPSAPSTPGQSARLDHPGKVGGSDTWEDSESWQHRRSTPTSCVNAR